MKKVLFQRFKLLLAILLLVNFLVPQNLIYGGWGIKIAGVNISHHNTGNPPSVNVDKAVHDTTKAVGKGTEAAVREAKTPKGALKLVATVTATCVGGPLAGAAANTLCSFATSDKPHTLKNLGKTAAVCTVSSYAGGCFTPTSGIMSSVACGAANGALSNAAGDMTSQYLYEHKVDLKQTAKSAGRGVITGAASGAINYSGQGSQGTQFDLPELSQTFSKTLATGMTTGTLGNMYDQYTTNHRINVSNAIQQGTHDAVWSGMTHMAERGVEEGIDYYKEWARAKENGDVKKQREIEQIIRGEKQEQDREPDERYSNTKRDRRLVQKEDQLKDEKSELYKEWQKSLYGKSFLTKSQIEGRIADIDIKLLNIQQASKWDSSFENQSSSSNFPCAKDNPKRGAWCDKKMENDAINGGAWEDPCFTGETLVNTPNGFRPIKEIHLGDSVYACDESNGVCEIKTVTETFKRKTSQIIELKIDSELIKVTPNHPIYVDNKGWTPAGELAIGDFVKSMNGDLLKVNDISPSIGKFTVYNLGVGDYQSLGISFENSYVSTNLVDTYNESKKIVEVKPIKNIKIGEAVWDNSSESFKYVVNKQVKKVSDLLLIHAEDEFGGKVSIKITRDHVFYRNDGSKIHGWELTTGIPLTVRGRLLLITEINTLLGSFNTYKIDVSDRPANIAVECSQSEDDCLSSSDNFHNYYVGKCGDGALVHNCHLVRSVAPGADSVASVYEATAGKDACSGRQLSDGERALKAGDAAKGILPPLVRGIYQGGKVAYKIANKEGQSSVDKNEVKQNLGRQGKQERLRELANDDKLGAADRGWLKQEINHAERGGRGQNELKNLRNPPGKDLAHERGREAAKGFDYEHANLQDKDLHRLQHKHDNYGKKNKIRPLED